LGIELGNIRAICLRSQIMTLLETGSWNHNLWLQVFVDPWWDHEDITICDHPGTSWGKTERHHPLWVGIR
jgi:hypothetical protein